jgi:hypothetical protein
MAKIFDNVNPGDLITSDLFNKMIAKIEEHEVRIAALERTATGIIFGTVNENVKGVPSPIKGARVYARTDAETRTTQTDQDGKYSITNLLPGKYQVLAEAENFAGGSEVDALVASGVTSTVNFVLTSSVNRVEVPDVQGLSLSDALKKVGEHKLTKGCIKDTESHDVDITKDLNLDTRIVINQNVNPGGFLAEGTPINLFVGAAPKTTPSIKRLKPNQGGSGSEVTIEGSGFGLELGKVIISGTEAPTTQNNWSDSKIKFGIPKMGTGTYDVQVINNEGEASNTVQFTIPDIR